MWHAEQEAKQNQEHNEVQLLWKQRASAVVQVKKTVR